MGRFTQADTIVPKPGNSQSWDRFTYSLNNPTKYIDPSGYCEGDPNDPTNPDKECWRLFNNFPNWFPNISLVEHTQWNTHSLTNILIALVRVRRAFGGQQGFKQAFGNFIIYGPKSQLSSLVSKYTPGMVPPVFQTVILTSDIFDRADVIMAIIHELGHIFDFQEKGVISTEYRSYWFVKMWGGDCQSKILGCKGPGSTYPGLLAGAGYQPNPKETTYIGLFSSIDDFAESFAAAVVKISDVNFENKINSFRIGILNKMILPTIINDY